MSSDSMAERSLETGLLIVISFPLDTVSTMLLIVMSFPLDAVSMSVCCVSRSVAQWRGCSVVVDGVTDDPVVDGSGQIGRRSCCRRQWAE